MRCIPIENILPIFSLPFHCIGIDFYNDRQEYLESHIIGANDVIILATGGHGFEVIEDIEMFEIKQGPYAGDNDKTKFTGINKNKAKTFNPK